MQMQIAEFIASLQVKPDAGSLKKGDQFLRIVEKKFQRSAKRMEKLNLLGSAYKANLPQLQKSLDAAARQVHLPLNRFQVNVAALQRTMQLAAQGVVLPIRIDPKGRTPRGTSQATGGTSQRTGTNPRGRFGISPSGVMMGAGGVSIFGGMGVMALNKVVQELQLLPVAMKAVMDGDQAKTDAEMQFLRGLGGRLGMTQRELVPDYTKFLASARGSELEPYVRTGYESLTKYGMVMGLDQETMRKTFRGFTQMIGKGQVMSEELKNQVAEHMPGLMQMAADEAAGGSKPKLFKMMKEGKLLPEKLLPGLFARMGVKADEGMDDFNKTVRRQEKRTKVAFENFLTIFSQSGGEQGFFKLWKSFADTLPRLGTLASSLGAAFSGFARGVSGIADIFVLANDGLAKFQELNPIVQSGLVSLGTAFLLLGTKMGRAFLPLIAAFIVLEDIASYHLGKKSITGLAMGVDYDGYQKKAGVPKHLQGLPFAADSEIYRKNLTKPGHMSLGQHATGIFSTVMTGAAYGIRETFNPLPKLPTSTLTPDAAARSAESNKEAFLSKYAGISPASSVSGGSNFGDIVVNINANTDDPEKLGFITRREIQQAIANSANNE